MYISNLSYWLYIILKYFLNCPAASSLCPWLKSKSIAVFRKVSSRKNVQEAVTSWMMSSALLGLRSEDPLERAGLVSCLIACKGKVSQASQKFCIKPSQCIVLIHVNMQYVCEETNRPDIHTSGH